MNTLTESGKDIIDRYINGEIDDKERLYIISLFQENNLYFKNSIEKDWDRIINDPAKTAVNSNHTLDKVLYAIYKNENLKKNKPLQKLKSVYSKVAAILFIPLLLTGILVSEYKEYNLKTEPDNRVNSTIYAPLGSRVSFNLPDGTTGMLNNGSYLSYSLPFNNDRTVSFDGEAWFNVKSDEDHPFRIMTGDLSVRVLGTSFNICAYSSEKYIEIVLDKGKMELLNNLNNEIVTMSPAERLFYQDGIIKKSVTDPKKYYAWTEGKLVFKGDPMKEVARRIERWYNVKIEIIDPGLLDYSLWGTFEDDKLEDVMKFISMTSPIRYRITPRELLPDGTFSKEKVTISKR